MGTTTRDVSVSDTQKERDGGSTPPDPPRRGEPCGACGSENTVCLHLESGGSMVGHWYEDEWVCGECGKYTIHELDYDS